MKRSAADDAEMEESNPTISVVEDVDRKAIEGLRSKVSSCADVLRGACNGKMRFDPGHFVEEIKSLQTWIRKCDSELEEAWFSGFFEEEGSGKEMITTVAVRKVSVETSQHIIVLF
jgi:hypothetical protein